ncbi:MAG: SDR family NAD(P)-dependent oxidoreductase [Myxococcota bacterium]|nr:SDR family NAD(P)-dependent oxidoreductase [Myxococcota bacterium]
MRLEGKVAVVTGAGRGIGREEALAFAREGAAVIVNDFGGGPDGSGGAEEPAVEVCDSITSTGGKALPHFGDVSRMETGQELVQLALDNFGRLDILVNNAGILRDRMIYNMSEQEWDAVIAVHLKGTFVCTRAAARIFRERRSGVIVNTSSESGLGNMGQANYAAAKEGIIGFTNTVARDLGRYGCRANAIRPRAATRLTLSDELREAAERARSEGQPAPDLGPLERWAPDGVAPFVVWLCTDAAAQVNGRNFIVSNDQVTLMTEVTQERSLFGTGGWTLDQLDAQLPSTVTAGLRNRFPAREPQK